MEKLVTVLILIGIFAIAAFFGWLFWKIFDWRWAKLERKERELHPEYFELNEYFLKRSTSAIKLRQKKEEIQKEILRLNKELLFVPRVEHFEIEKRIYSLQKEYKTVCKKLEIISNRNEAIFKELEEYRKKWSLKT